MNIDLIIDFDNESFEVSASELARLLRTEALKIEHDETASVISRDRRRRIRRFRIFDEAVRERAQLAVDGETISLQALTSAPDYIARVAKKKLGQGALECADYDLLEFVERAIATERSMKT